MEINGKRALVTGATGFIGGHLAERLATREGVVVRALARRPEKGCRLVDLGVEVVPGDISEPRSLDRAMAGCQLTFHAAGWVEERGGKDQVWGVNVIGTQNVVNAALAAGVQRFVHLSSSYVYAYSKQHNIDETMPPRKSGNLYGDSKIAAEEIVFRAHRENGLPAVAARPSQVYGPGSPQFAIRPVQAIKAGRMSLIDGGRGLFKPVYIDNLIDGLVLCAKVDATVGEAINLTDGIAVPWRDFFGAYGRILGVEAFRSLPYPLAWLIAYCNEIRVALKGKEARMNRGAVKAMRSRNSFSNDKARRLLGWTPNVDFEEGMKRTEAWLRAEGYIADRGSNPTEDAKGL